jgi:hypothetical protein
MEGKIMRRILIGLTLALIALPAAADQAVDELVNIFAEACLTRFPDETAIRHYAGENRLAIMPDEQLHRLLGTDPGEGWLQNTSRGQYPLTIEMPPYHTCAIRKAVAQQTVFLPVFSQTLTAWAAKQPGTSLKEMPSQTPNIDGLPSTVYIWELHRGPDTQAEKLIAIVTNFSDGAAELRLARAIGNR